LQAAATDAGFQLAIASGYRNFDRQLLIWNEKACGKRPVLDAEGELVAMEKLSDWQQVQAILRWSALPGGSRHHWGTDIDVYDRAAVPSNYQLQLTLQECYGHGPFAALHEWLDDQINNDQSYGFFRPYQYDRGGIAPERWHLSYAPLSSAYQRDLTIDMLASVLLSTTIALQEVLLANLDEIYQRYVVVADDCYPVQFQKNLFVTEGLL
jgi:LAS superfamily LD-carboxypeptidase LdcB